MAEKTTRRRRRRVVRRKQEETVPEDELLEEEIEEEDEDDADADAEEEEAPQPRRRRSRKTKAESEEEGEEEEDDEEEDDESLDDVEEYDDSPRAEFGDGNVISAIFDAMAEGQIAVLKKVDSRTILMTLTVEDAGLSVAAGPRKLSGKEYWQEVLDPDYNEWREEWVELTYEEKVARAKKAKVKWEEHENPKVDVMRLTEAYRKHLGVHKYKPEYRSRSARSAVRK